MKTIGPLISPALSGSALLVLAVVDCGGKTGAELNPTPGAITGGYVSVGGSPGLGGYVAAGGSYHAGGVSPVGGSSALTLVGTRIPAIHRASAQSCVGVNSPPEPSIRYPENSSCLKHADCVDGVNGKCVTGVGSASSMGFCAYDECATDGDCNAGKVCYCTSTTAARCFSLGNCQVDADCANTGNSYCSPSMGFDCGGYRSIDSFYCHTAADTCQDDQDCSGTNYCNYDVYNGNWKCTATNNNCIIG
jgi:hypothetical protein